MSQSIQVLGALSVLAGYILSQRGVVDMSSRWYLVLNLIGSAILTGFAVVDLQYGFLLLQGVWAAISAAGLVRTFRSPKLSEA